MLTIKTIDIPGYDKVIEAKDPSRGLHCFIAVHSCILGPSLGGTRIHKYANPDEALADVLRLAKAMTYKSAAIEDGLGGGKSVIIADPHTEKTPELLQAFAEVVDSLKGMYIAAEDVGSTTDDLEFIHKFTPYVACTMRKQSSGDPSYFTAWGVLRGIHAVAQKLWGSPSLSDKTIAIQGLGSVGSKLAHLLFWEGADLIVCDVHSKLTEHSVNCYGAQVIDPRDFFQTQCDILSPCALGGVINRETIPLLKCKAIAGAANNQLDTPQQGEELLKRNILYAPDYIINAGGIINAAAEFEEGGYNPKKAREKVDHLYDTLLTIFTQSEKKHLPTNVIADEIVQYNLSHQIGKRKTPIKFN